MPSNVSNLNVKMGEISKRITINVKIDGLKWWAFRLQIAALLFRLGAWVAGMGIEITESESK